MAESAYLQALARAHGRPRPVERAIESTAPTSRSTASVCTRSSSEAGFTRSISIVVAAHAPLVAIWSQLSRRVAASVSLPGRRWP
jgi:hypothetical protein